MNTTAPRMTTSDIQSDRFDFTVEQVPLRDPEGRTTRFFGNRRTDTGEVLGVVTERYEVLQNATLFDNFEKIVTGKGFGRFNRKVVATHNGARCRAIYDFPETGIRLVNGNELTFRLKVQNSFDGSLRASLAVGLFRLICSNGLAAPAGALAMTRKHTTGLDGELIEDAFSRSVDKFQEAAPLFNRMIDLRVNQSEGNRILLNLEKAKVMSERMREGIQQVWERPTYNEDGQRNLFNLYNAATQHLTHSVEGKRFELAERVNTGILNAFTRAAKQGSIDDLAAVLRNPEPALN